MIGIPTTGCGSSASSPETGAAGGRTAVVIKGFEFAPAEVTVSAGTRLTFTNDDSAEHTATATDGSFDTGTLDTGGESRTVTLDTPGTYGYYCKFHPFMKATVTVAGSD